MTGTGKVIDGLVGIIEDLLDAISNIGALPTSVYLIAYDVHPKEDTEEAKDEAEKRRKAIRDWVAEVSGGQKRPLSESAYIVNTKLSRAELAKKVDTLFRWYDDYYIVQLASYVGGRGATADWLANRLRRTRSQPR